MAQMQLLSELHLRFPEVPVEVISIIMQKVSCDICMLC